VAFEIADLMRLATSRVERHINCSATLPIKCGAPHFMLELGTSGSVGGEGGNVLVYPAVHAEAGDALIAFVSATVQAPTGATGSSAFAAGQVRHQVTPKGA
jgi:hypothetical protein